MKKTKKQTKQKIWEWESKQKEAFDHLKDKLSSAPILSYSDYNKSFEIHTDTSGQGLGAVLNQEQGEFKKESLPMPVANYQEQRRIFQLTNLNSLHSNGLFVTNLW